MNAALPLLAASLLTDEPLILRNVPRIRDVQTICQLLSDLGVEIAEAGEHTLRLLVNLLVDVSYAYLDPRVRLT
mgnify:CR=1 FL=1